MEEILGYLAFFVYFKTTELASKHLKKLDLTTKEATLLELIASNPTASQVEIAHAAGMKTPLLVKILDDLTRKGFVLRESSIEDRRRHTLKLTKAAEALRTQIRDCHFAGNTEILEGAGLSTEESKTLYKLLQKLTTHIQETRK